MSDDTMGAVSSHSRENLRRMHGDIPPALRLPLLMLGFVSLVMGVIAGLARLGWRVPLGAPQLMALHGPLMVSGFLGTVIGLERAVALRRRWAHAGPLLTGLGGIALLVGLPQAVGATAMVLGSAVLLAGSAAIACRQRALWSITMALGAASWMGGNVLWLLGVSVSEFVPLWINFLVLTIAGERLELSRLLPPSPKAKMLFAGIVVVLLAASSVIWWPDEIRIYAIGILALALWLAQQDIARRTVHEVGLTRFIAVCLLSGYAWLVAAGLVLLVSGTLAGTSYDAVLHATFLGFVFSMIFGHALVIFPSVTRIKMPYHWSLYLPLVALHLSLALRLGGDVLALSSLQRLGGLLNALAIALFILGIITSAIRGRRGAAETYT